jgi:ankyrin repeat protein
MIQFRPYNPSIPERLRIALFKHNFAATKDRDRMKRIEAMIGVGNAMLTSLLARNDIAEAMTWFSRAAKEGSQEGQEMVFRLERHMKRSVVELIPGVGQKDRATWMVECLLRNFLDDAVGGPASTGLDVDNLQRRLKHILLGFDTEMIENGLQRAIDNDIVRMRTMKKGYHREDENWADFPGLLVAIQSDDVQALNDALSSYESAISVETKQLLVFTACEERSENVLRALVQVHHFDLDASFGNALHDALRRDDSGIASLLTDLGAPWNFVLAGESLHYIICGCSNSTVRHLMHLVSALPLAFPECPSYVDPVVRQRETMDGIRFGMAVHPQDDNDTVDNLHPPLFDAILHNRVYSVRVILALGANPNIRYMGMTALHLAASLLLPWMVAILLAYGADPNARDFRRAHQTPLHQVSMAYFVVRPSGVNKYGEYRDIFGNLFIPAPEYLNEGDSHRRLIIHLLLAYRADLQTLDDHDSTPLMRALESRHAYAPMVARCLIDLGADVSKTGVRGLSAVHAATVGQNLQILRHLLYDTDAALLNQATKEGMTPLHFAAATGRLGSLAILLEAGADISVRNKNGFTAFDIAMMSEQKQAFDLFLHHINQLPQRARDVVVYLHGNMWTAAHSALKCQDRLIGTYFLMKAMPLVREIEKRGVLGYTPLHFAVWRKNGPALEFLIKKGADVNIRAFKGMTPLHVAYGVGDRTLIEFLISQKADTTIKNELDLTPPEFGIQAGQNPEILQHIFEEGMSLLTDAAASEKISQRLNANVKQEKERLAEESQYAFEDRFTLGSSERVTMVETAHSEILEVSIRKYGENHFESLWRMNNLGCVYERYGRKRKAEQMYRRGWRISLQVLGREHRLSQDFANKIARVLADSGQTDDKEIREWISEFGRETLEPPLMPFLCTAAERKPTVLPSAVVPALSPSKPDKTQPTVLPSTALSGPSLSNSDEKAAETLPTHHSWQPQDDLPALEERETALNQEHMQLTDAFRELGTLYIKQGKLEKAENVLQRALETYEKVLGPVDLKTLRVAIDLGATYQSQDKLDQSESMYRRALEGFQKAWETQMENSMKTLRPVEYIHDEAKIYKAEATRTTAKFGESKKAMDEIGMLILKAASSLGSVYLSQEKLEDAENMYLRALESYNKDSDVDQTSVIITVKGLRSILVKRGFNQTPQPEGIIDNRFKVLIALIKLAFDWKGSPIFGTLGRVLMWVSDERGAKAALSHEIVVRLDGNSVYDSVQCDGCHAPLTYAMKRFVCKRCEDIDLCGDCLKKHEKGVQQLLTCVDHSFLEVTDELSAWSGERSYDETAMRNAWLDRLFMTYVEAAWRQTLV